MMHQTPEQIEENRQKADQVRFARADTAFFVRNGLIQVSDLIADIPWYLKNYSIENVLMMRKSTGKFYANKVLDRFAINPERRMKELTLRQRSCLVNVLEKMEAGTEKRRKKI